jgi:hypothetical protein
MRRRAAGAGILLIMVLGACNFNAPIKYDIDYYLSVTNKVNSWEELRTAVNGTPSGGSAVITVMTSFPAGTTITINNNRTVTIVPYKNGAVISRGSSTASFFNVTDGTLKLGYERPPYATTVLALDGSGKNAVEALVKVDTDGSLFLYNAEIRNNNNNDDDVSGAKGGGVNVTGNGAFTMAGGKIIGNTVFSSNGIAYGGGVCFESTGTFTMSGGQISENQTSESSTGTAYSCGGGVYIDGGTFTMSGGSISDNKVLGRDSGGYGRGGGVYFSSTGTFTMSGGNISHNESSAEGSEASGGGVCVWSGNFTMSGGIISENIVLSRTSNAYGGGVYFLTGSFTMSGGSISGNTVQILNIGFGNARGGGVYTLGGTFKKQPSISNPTGGSGIIYGVDAPVGLKNYAESNAGHAVYISSGQRNTTAGADVPLDSTVTGSAGGWGL